MSAGPMFTLPDGRVVPLVNTPVQMQVTLTTVLDDGNRIEEEQ